MKLSTIALAFAFTLSSTYVLAYTNHHKSGARTHYGSYARMQPQQPGWNNNGWNNNNNWNNNYRPNYNYGGGPNNRGGLVGGDDSGTYKP
jgi:hypothetical protein